MSSADEAKARLWLELRSSFEDVDRVHHAGSDVGFGDLTDADILRVWDYVRGRATSISEREV
jgi:hypothetical protein